MSRLPETFQAFFATPQDETKEFSRPGGFKGKAISPYYYVKRLTERFGLCGKGWMVKHYDTQTVASPLGQTAVYVLLSLLYKEEGDKEWNEVGPHYGGDVVFDVLKVERQKKNADGSIQILECDDEAFKKAYTDAFSKCCSWLGLGGDVHDGMTDGNKYVADKPWDVSRTESIAAMKKEGQPKSKPAPAPAKNLDEPPPLDLGPEPEMPPPPDSEMGIEEMPKAPERGWGLEQEGAFSSLIGTDLYNVFKMSGHTDMHKKEADVWRERKKQGTASDVLKALEDRILVLKTAAQAALDKAKGAAPAPRKAAGEDPSNIPEVGTPEYAEAAKKALGDACRRFETAYAKQAVEDPHAETIQMREKVLSDLRVVWSKDPDSNKVHPDEKKMQLAASMQTMANRLKIP
jgi:hypothetical protein